jgi:hypothetical protein
MRRTFRIIGYVLGGLLVLSLGGFAFLYWKVSNPSEDPQSLPEGLVSSDAPEGVALLDSASSKADHALLTAVFQPQQKGSWCGVASSVSALRALQIAPHMTQEGFFTDEASSVRSKLAVTFGGMTLDELGSLLEAHGARVVVVHASDSDLDRFRAAASANLADPSNVLLVNYLRERLDQGNMGHISPVAAYDSASDRVLVLDTATYKWPATWVKTSDLFGAMNTQDTSSGKSRGYVEVSARPPG